MEAVSSLSDGFSLTSDTSLQKEPGFLAMVFRLVRIDLYKLRRQRLIFLLIGVAFIFMALFSFLETIVFINNISHAATEPLYFAGDTLEQHIVFYLRAMTFPDTLILSAVIVVMSLTVPLNILAASLIGTDYRSGMLRFLLARGVTRTEYLLAKIVTICAIVTISVIPAIVFEILYRLLIMRLLVPDVAPDPFVVNWSWLGLALLFLGIVLIGMVIYTMLAACLSILGRSTALGVAGGLFFWIGEFVGDSSLPIALKGQHASPGAFFLQSLPRNAVISLLNWFTPALAPLDHLSAIFWTADLTNGFSIPILQPISFIIPSATGDYYGLSPLPQTILTVSLYLLIPMTLTWFVHVRRDVTS